MKINDVMERYINATDFSRATGIPRRAWYRWIDYGYVPIKAQFKLQKITDGELKASIDDIPEDRRG